MRKMGIGLQLYTVRENTEKDFLGTLKQIADMGYEGVEFAGYGDIPADQMRDALKQFGLTAIGSHVAVEKLESNLDEEIAYLKTIGAKHFTCPYLTEERIGSEENWKRLFDLLTHCGEQAAKHGLQFSYHNHDFEFEQKVNGNFAFDEMYRTVPSQLLKVEMDIGWVHYAGQDPVAYINKYGDRLPLLHIKDYRKNPEVSHIDTVELGQGELPLQDILQAASDNQTEWLIVEQDHCERPALEAVQTSIEWLKQNYLPLTK